MARKKGNPVHGWLVLDKPQGMTSTKAVGRLKYLFNAKKAGHAGTLDPLATGILPIAFGEATKTVSFIMDGQKSYRFGVKWGVETTTDDSEGEETATSSFIPSEEDVRTILPDFVGEISQIPPKYSAIKVDGARAYDLARDGEEVSLEARSVKIDRLELLECREDGIFVFETDCGKGTYVRSLARDMGRAVGSYGHIVELRRTRVGPFCEDDIISLDMVEEISHSAAGCEALYDLLMPVETALDDIPALAINGQDAQRLKQGQAVLLRGRDAPILKGPVYAMSRGTLVAVGEISRGELKPTRVFNLSA